MKIHILIIKQKRNKLIEDEEWFNYVASLNEEDMHIYKTALDLRDKRRQKNKSRILKFIDRDDFLEINSRA